MPYLVSVAITAATAKAQAFAIVSMFEKKTVKITLI